MDLQDFERGFARICSDIGRGFSRIRKTLGEDLQGFMRLWERIRKYSQDFGRGFTRNC